MNTLLLPFALLCTLLYAGLAIQPFSPSGINWNDGLALLSARQTVADFDLQSVWLAALPGFAWLGAVWPRRSTARFAATAGVFLGLISAFLLLHVGQIVYTSRQVSDSSLLASGFGILLGISVWWMIGTRLPRINLPATWPVLAMIALLPLLLPWDTATPSASLESYFTEFPQRIYIAIKSALIWVPVGFLFSVSGRHEEVPRWGIAWTLALLLAALPVLAGQQLSDFLALLFSLPGVWLGAWLGHHAAATLKTEASGSARAAAVPVSMQATDPTPLPSQPAPEPTQTQPERTSTHTHSRHGVRKRIHSHTHPLRIVAGVSLLTTAGLLLSGFPFFWPAALAGGLALYAVALWFWPLLWLVVVPAALPLLDLAPWTGRFFLDEFDLLILTTAGTLFLRGRKWPSPTMTPAWPLFALWGGSILISALLGLGWPPPLDANAFSSYWSPYNSLRVAKGFVWGALLFLLLRLTRADTEQLVRRLALGMGLGLLGVGLVGAWEHALFVGFEGHHENYRIISLFSSMHTGGGHIEAYLVAALPFLWLATPRFRDLVFTGPLMVLTAYVMVYTVARGGVLATALAIFILFLGSVRLALRTKGHRYIAPLSMLLLVTLVLAAGVGGGYFQKRFTETGRDWQTRVDHWSQALNMMDGSIQAQLFGMGLGSFPRIYLERGPAANQPATFGFVTEQDNTFFRIGTGQTIYYAQRIAFRGGQDYRLEVDVRSSQGDARIDTPICEKQMLSSRQCVWQSQAVPGDGQWHHLSQTIPRTKVGTEDWLHRPPVELFLFNPGKGGVVDVDNLRLLDRDGHDLLCNGDFSHGGDCWFFKTHSHLPWHIKNVWVHVLFEQGWVGLILFSAVIALALSRLARAGWQGHRLAWAWLASLSGLLAVGMFDSLLDAPRLATLLLLLLLLGCGQPWVERTRSRDSHHKKSGR